MPSIVVVFCCCFLHGGVSHLKKKKKKDVGQNTSFLSSPSHSSPPPSILLPVCYDFPLQRCTSRPACLLDYMDNGVCQGTTNKRKVHYHVAKKPRPACSSI
ncbi:MAG: hypothetical protein BYD32DRAFT_431700, partial [Podila humilis]